jgi:valyl-tRNA synthetase
MSKSLGNTIDPLDVIQGITLDELLDKTKTYPVPQKLLPQVIKGLKDEFPDGILASGADGLRFTLLSLSGQGRDIKLSIPRVAGYRAFLNKIWNATRFALMRTEGLPVRPIDEIKDQMSMADRWIVSRLQKVSEKASQGIAQYRFNETADAIYHFFWSEFCDWYIELVKGALSDQASDAQKESACSVLMTVLDQSMRLLHPLCPFQSEEIWQKLPGRSVRWPNQAYCATAPYPEADQTWVDEEAEKVMTLFQETLTMSRNARHESGIPIQKKVPVVVLTENVLLTSTLEGYQKELKRMGQMSDVSISVPQAFDIPQQAAVNSGSEMDVVILLEGLIDLDAERERLGKEIEKLEKRRTSLKRRLDSAGFIAKAPAQVVEESRNTLKEIEDQITKFSERLNELKK